MRLNIQGWLKKQIETLFSAKANVNSDNFTTAGKKNIVSFGMPNYSAAQDVTASCYVSSGYGFNPPKDGYLFIAGGNNSGGSCRLYIYDKNGNTVINRIIQKNDDLYGITSSFSIMCNKNFYYRVYNYAGAQDIVFIPIVGA